MGIGKIILVGLGFIFIVLGFLFGILPPIPDFTDLFTTLPIFLFLGLDRFIVCVGLIIVGLFLSWPFIRPPALKLWGFIRKVLPF